MTSVTDICNRALTEAGSRSSISSIDENSPAAIQCRRFYESTRDSVLQMAWWNFTRYFANLSLLKALPGTPENPTGTFSNTFLPEWPAAPWLYSYAYPSDCILFRYVQPAMVVNGFSIPPTSAPLQLMAPPYRYAGPAIQFVSAMDKNDADQDIRVILTNQSQAAACYNKRVTDLSLWSPLAIDALVYGLAGRLSIPLSGKRTLMNDNYTLANNAVTQARQYDGNEGLTVYDNIPDWIAARDGRPFAGWIGPTPNYGPLFGVGSV